jgi:hypothetical protein
MGLAAAVVFAISHALPAYADGSGFACFRLTLGVLIGRDIKFLSGGWFYYAGFGLSNLLFVVLVVALCVTRKWRTVRTLVSVVLLLHVLSWPILNACGSPPTLHDVKLGYYLWLMAYGLLVAAHLWKGPTELGDSASITSLAK